MMDSASKEFLVAVINLGVKHSLSSFNYAQFEIAFDRRRVTRYRGSLKEYGIRYTIDDNKFVIPVKQNLTKLINAVFPNATVPTFDLPQDPQVCRKILENFYGGGRYENFFYAGRLNYEQMAAIYLNRHDYAIRGNTDDLTVIPKSWRDEALEKVRAIGKIDNITRNHHGLYQYLRQRGLKEPMAIGELLGDVDPQRSASTTQFVKNHFFELNNTKSFEETRPYAKASWLSKGMNELARAEQELRRAQERVQTLSQLRDLGGDKLAIDFLKTQD